MPGKQQRSIIRRQRRVPWLYTVLQDASGLLIVKNIVTGTVVAIRKKEK